MRMANGTAGPRGKGHLQATRAGGGSAALVYSSLGKPIPVRLDKFAAGRIATSWFAPRMYALRHVRNSRRVHLPPTSRASRGIDEVPIQSSTHVVEAVWTEI